MVGVVMTSPHSSTVRSLALRALRTICLNPPPPQPQQQLQVGESQQPTPLPLLPVTYSWLLQRLLDARRGALQAKGANREFFKLLQEVSVLWKRLVCMAHCAPLRSLLNGLRYGTARPHARRVNVTQCPIDRLCSASACCTVWHVTRSWVVHRLSMRALNVFLAWHMVPNHTSPYKCARHNPTMRLNTVPRTLHGARLWSCCPRSRSR